jgi:hypothetical protein
VAILRGRRVPPAVRDIAGREQVLGHGTTRDGDLVVATLTGLHLPTEEGTLAWDQVVRASWNMGRLDLTVQLVPGGGPRELALELADPGSLPQAVRDRVTTSIVAERHVRFDGDLGARFVARRTTVGEVRWAVIIDPGLDPADPAVRARAADALDRLRSSWGV